MKEMLAIPSMLESLSTVKPPIISIRPLEPALLKSTSVKRGEEMTYAEFPLKCADWIGKYAYVRMSVIDRDGKHAWTNPIFLDGTDEQ